MQRLGFTPRGETHWHGYDVLWYALDRSAVSAASCRATR